MLIDWLESAFVDLHRIREYIRQFNPVAAQKTIACIEATATNLARFPEMGRSGEVPGTRELVISRLPYFLVYRLDGDTVHILRVLHDKQKWPPIS
jgi:toxin ParE1/3/4